MGGSLDCNVVGDAYEWVPAFEPARTSYTILAQALHEMLGMASAEALSAALLLADNPLAQLFLTATCAAQNSFRENPMGK